MSRLEYSVFFCDDVRQEINGKFSLVGIYLNDLNVHIDENQKKDAIPALSEFCIVCVFKHMDKRKKYKIIIEQTGVPEKTIALEEDVAQQDNKSMLVFNIRNFIVPKEGVLEVSLLSGKEKIKLDELKLKKIKKIS